MMKRMSESATDAQAALPTSLNIPRWCHKERAERDQSVLWEAQLPSQGELDMFVHCPAVIHKYSCGFRAAAKTTHLLFLLNLHF